VTFLVAAGMAVLYGYGSYWALRLRQALFDRLYRERALQVGTAAAFFTALAVSYFFIGVLGSDNFYLSFLQYLIDDLAAIVTFAWVDSTLIMMRRLDPLRRNTLHWSRVRVVFWALVIISSIGGLVSVVITRAIFFSAEGAQGVLLTGPFGFSTFGFIAVLVNWKRSRPPMLRSHLRWFILYFLSIWIASAATGGTYLASIPAFRTVSALALTVGGYFLYKAAKSLAPLNKLSSLDENPSKSN